MLLNVSTQIYPHECFSRTCIFQHGDSFVTEIKTRLMNPQNYFQYSESEKDFSGRMWVILDFLTVVFPEILNFLNMTVT